MIVRSLHEFYEKLPAPMERDVDGRFYRKGVPDVPPSYGREYRGFIPYAGGAKPGTKAYYKDGMRDFDRMRGLENGRWCFIGVRACAEVSTHFAEGYKKLQKFSSAGLWGIESDSGDYLNEVGEEEFAQLKEELEAYGVSLKNFEELKAGAEVVGK